MSRRLRFGRLVWFACLSFAPMCGAETLRLRADSWMPYNGTPGDSLPGYAIEVAQAVCARENLTLDYQTMPWGEALKAAAAGEIDAVIGANEDEAQGLVQPQLPIGLPRVALITRKDSTWRYQNVASLRKVRLGVVLDYKYWTAIDDYIARTGEPQVVKYSGEHPLADALAQLSAGTIDVVAETTSVFSWTARRAGHGPGSFHILYLHEGDPVYFAFSPKGDAGKRFARAFDAGLRELRKSGELTRILARYGLVDWQE